MNIKVSHHLLLCATPTKAECCNHDVGKKSWSNLKNLIKQFGLDNPKRPEGIVLRSKVDCLRICQDGPILLIWPDGIWYGGVTKERMEVILQKHILKGIPILEWIIKETPLLVDKQASNLKSPKI